MCPHFTMALSLFLCSAFTGAAVPGGCYQGGRVSVQSTIAHAEDHVSNTNVYSGHHVCSQQGLKLTLFRNSPNNSNSLLYGCEVLGGYREYSHAHTHTHTRTHTHTHTHTHTYTHTTWLASFLLFPAERE